jgi:hypothetical protein
MRTTPWWCPIVCCVAALAWGAASIGSLAEPPRSADETSPLPVAVLERVMRTPPTEIRAQKWVAGWRFRVYEIEAYYPSIDGTFHLKWKPSTEELETRNNTPRREIAAYRIQQWFLGPEEYVVPTTLGLCIPLPVYAAIDPDATAVPAGSRCVFGTQAIWLEHVRPPEVLLDEARFRDDENYARNLEHYNLLTYLIENRDTRPANILVSADAPERRVFSIDNGVSFGEPFYNFFRTHWDSIRVPSLSNDSIGRLRDIAEKDVEALSVVAEFRMDDQGQLLETQPSQPFEAQRGVRMRGDVLQFGLTPQEIEGVRGRLRVLLAAVDAGEIPTR